MEEIITKDIFRNNLSRLTVDEYKWLEDSILKEGLRDKLIVWKLHNILIDGHHRYDICNKHSILITEANITYMDFDSEEDALWWAYNNQRSRRNWNEYDRVMHALKFENYHKKKAKERMSAGGKKHGKQVKEGQQNSTNLGEEPYDTYKKIAEDAGVSSDTIKKARRIRDNGTNEEKDKIRRGEESWHSTDKKIKEREKAQKEPVQQKQAPDGMVDRVAFRDISLRLKPFAGKESTTNTHYIGHHNGWAIAVDDKIAFMVRTGLKYSFAVAPDIIDTLDSCHSQFVGIEEGDGHVKVIFDRGNDDYSTSKTKPIDKTFTKYLTNIDTVDEQLKEITLPSDFINNVARCFSYKRKARGEAREVSSYREEELVLITGSSIISTDMWRASTYEINIEQPKMHLPFWLAAHLEALHKEDTVTSYAVHHGFMYFKLSSGFIVASKVPKVVEEHFPEKQIMEKFASFQKGEPIPLTTLIIDINRIIKDCKGKQDDVIKVRRTDALIKVTLDTGKMTIETVGSESAVHRSVPCRTRKSYEFSIATVHLEEALKFADTLYVGNGALLFEKGSYRHILPTCTNGVLDYLIKHEL
jgi:hypothetical protein